MRTKMYRKRFRNIPRYRGAGRSAKKKKKLAYGRRKAKYATASETWTWPTDGLSRRTVCLRVMSVDVGPVSTLLTAHSGPSARSPNRTVFTFRPATDRQTNSCSLATAATVSDNARSVYDRGRDGFTARRGSRHFSRRRK